MSEDSRVTVPLMAGPVATTVMLSVTSTSDTKLLRRTQQRHVKGHTRSHEVSFATGGVLERRERDPKRSRTLVMGRGSTSLKETINSVPSAATIFEDSFRRAPFSSTKERESKVSLVTGNRTVFGGAPHSLTETFTTNGAERRGKNKRYLS